MSTALGPESDARILAVFLSFDIVTGTRAPSAASWDSNAALARSATKFSTPSNSSSSKADSTCVCSEIQINYTC